MLNYRNPDPRRGEPRVGSAPDVAFWGNPVDPLDPLQNSVRLANVGFYNDFGTFSRNWGPTFRQSRLQGSKSDLQQEGNRSSSKSIYTNSRFTACVRPASNCLKR